MSTCYLMALEVQAPSVENVLPNDANSLSLSISIEEKRKTRQWAAWTRQEEENFFSALRQVGKNFAKITCRVQSKNKDQVRHYYYRLVRRINKLLAPGFCLDSKNSKDTIPAMLRWWSLLEKFSCTASKLHLKPRRFKIFIEALEQQLLKDRNKMRRKQSSSHGGNCSASLTTSVLNKAKASGNDVNIVKQLNGSQNPQRIKACKESPSKRNATTNSNFNKEDITSLKGARKKRRAGSVPSAAYKRWEKAAIAGVSLVADAAEQLEQTGNDRRFTDVATFDISFPGQNELRNVAKMMHCVPSQAPREECLHNIHEAVAQTSMKLKLQLFPVDESTRKALEKDSHNPHLELTLSCRKRMSSVLEHLSSKWGSSSIACGELALLPYGIHREDILSCRRWTMEDTVSCAADVHSTIGSPAIFRLRYGWFSGEELRFGASRVPSTALTLNDCLKLGNTVEVAHNNVPDLESSEVCPNRPDTTGQISQLMESLHPPEPSVGSTLVLRDVLPGFSRTLENGVNTCFKNDKFSEFQQDQLTLQAREDEAFSVREWADSIISVGDLFSEASMAAHSARPSLADGNAYPHQMNFSYDSFDHAIVTAHTNVQGMQGISVQVPQSPIWNGEETRDAFSLRLFADNKADCSNQLPETPSKTSLRRSCSSSLGFADYFKDLTQAAQAKQMDDPRHKVSKVLISPPEPAPADAENHNRVAESDEEAVFSDAADRDSIKSPCSLDAFWVDSLGLLDLDMPCSSYRHHEQDLVLGDSLSLGSFGRLAMISSSLDAFQNCTFGAERDIPANEAQEVLM